ncbi:LysR family transcriptional regulator [soil metagenome]
MGLARSDGNAPNWMLVIRFCMTDSTEWELLRTFEAVARHGSLTTAARALGVSQSTVSRQIAKLEAAAGSPLLLRELPIRLTDRGALVLAAVEPMVDAALVARAALSSTPELRGQVTVTTVGEVVRWVLVQRLPAFYKKFPHLRLRVLADNRQSSLAAGEADVALRMARPARGDLVARKVTRETFDFYAAASLPLSEEVPWMGLTGSLAEIPEQRHAERAFAGRPARLLLEDVESLGLAVQAGLGVAVLPQKFAARLSRVRKVRPHKIGAADLGPVPPRDLWLVVHRGKQQLPNVRAVMGWLGTIW